MKSNLQLAKKNVEYEWSTGFRNPLAKTDIRPVIKELRQLEQQHGEVNPLILLEASKSKRSYLHNYFEWDNDKAAHHWRVTQARYLLGCITVKVIKEGKPVRMQAYQITKPGGHKLGESTYTKFDAITESDTHFIQKSALNDLLRVQNKLEAHNLDTVLPLIRKAIQLLQKDVEVVKIA